MQTVDVSRLLSLPIELRRHIYYYVLPTTSQIPLRYQRPIISSEKPEYSLTLVRSSSRSETWKMQKTPSRVEKETGNDIVWARGSIGILGVCRQICEECLDIIYGESIFVIDVAFDSIKFRFRWLVPSSKLTPSRSMSFLEHFSQRNLLRIKNYVVNVEHVDNYTGMIKYNFGGPGLSAGIRTKVGELADLLSAVPYLTRLQIHLIDGAISRVRFPSGRVHRVQDEQNYSESEKVLNPFMRLYGVRLAKISGVSVEYGEMLEKSLTASRIT
ncbi:hypothetical protein BDV96DRAFT_494000 [Lophiotrema nucula]|uniref:DUF7730 domain-containing protein n=1 Tax=Lophiotrema nucula TaxID=690887 RepID=A0A6A5Z7B1_9PLEO|nr:hypothetical protein BDV96DRAFT_494000 [Lophiotrema nucula]